MNTLAKAGRVALFLTLTVALALATGRADASGVSTYISLGDSIAYGSGTSQDAAPGASFQTGFVSQFGGASPSVINLALPYETLGTFITGNPNFAANTYYNAPADTQNGVFMHYMAQELASGHQIGTMTVALGIQDVLNILNTPGFAKLTLVQQATAVQDGLARIQSQYDTIMNEIRNVLPTTKIDLIGAYNPFHATPSNPLAEIAEPAFVGLNHIIQGEASKFGAQYIDTYTAFLGHESTYTGILAGNPNPTTAGYSAIAEQLGATVPEPGTLFAAGFGLAALALRHRARRLAG